MWYNFAEKIGVTCLNDEQIEEAGESDCSGYLLYKPENAS